MTKPQVTIYTDGGSEPNPGPGGWGAILLFERDGKTHEKELSGADRDSTNNRMELTAAIEALRALNEPCQVALITDSEYLRQGITSWLHDWIKRGWTRKGDQPIQNLDLWQTLHAEVQRHEIDWRWVKGHAGNRYNERVDRLATAARRQLTGAAPVAAPPAAVDAQHQIALRVSAPKPGGRGGYAFRIRDAVAGTEDSAVGTADDATSNRLILIAAADALRRLPPDAAVAVYCPDAYLHQGMTQWVDSWRRRQWKTKDGSPVKNQPEWRALAEVAATRRAAWLPKDGEPDGLSDGLDKRAAEAARGTAEPGDSSRTGRD